MIYFEFILGLFLLIKGADFLVKGASSLARRFGLSNLIIGLTVVSFGTSMPELIVNVMASINNNPGIAIGNILGSNIANVLLIIGISAIIAPLPIKNSTVLSEIPFSIASIALVGFFVNSKIPWEQGELQLSRWEGVILLFFFLLFMAYIFNQAKNKEETIAEEQPRQNLVNSWLWIITGCGALFVGGKWIVKGAVYLAQIFGLDESLIGLTVVAVGTSLPELATSAVAAYRKNTDIAVGNVVGSNIFNLLWILGISAIIKPLKFSPIYNMDILMVLFSSSLLIPALVVGKKNHIDRLNGTIFLLIYLGYLFYLIQNSVD